MSCMTLKADGVFLVYLFSVELIELTGSRLNQSTTYLKAKTLFNLAESLTYLIAFHK